MPLALKALGTLSKSQYGVTAPGARAAASRADSTESLRGPVTWMMEQIPKG
jgi:hypothetical protein